MEINTRKTSDSTELNVTGDFGGRASPTRPMNLEFQKDSSKNIFEKYEKSDFKFSEHGKAYEGNKTKKQNSMNTQSPNQNDISLNFDYLDENSFCKDSNIKNLQMQSRLLNLSEWENSDGEISMSKGTEEFHIGHEDVDFDLEQERILDKILEDDDENLQSVRPSTVPRGKTSLGRNEFTVIDGNKGIKIDLKELNMIEKKYAEVESVESKSIKMQNIDEFTLKMEHNNRKIIDMIKKKSLEKIVKDFLRNRLKNPYETNYKTKDKGKSYIHYACKRQSKSIIDVLIKENID